MSDIQFEKLYTLFCIWFGAWLTFRIVGLFDQLWTGSLEFYKQRKLQLIGREAAENLQRSLSAIVEEHRKQCEKVVAQEKGVQ